MDKLNAEQLAELQSWQRRMVAAFSATMAGLVLAVIADFVFGLDRAWARGIFALLVALVAWSGFVQFRQKCPACGYRIGFQSRLLLPAQCKKCGVSFRDTQSRAEAL